MNDKSTNSVLVNQVLHGYDKGHTLIASSVTISSEAKRILLSLTDMSGPRLQLGFEEYLTGYPLKEINAYAIGKTWYASEMKRPGCVWTHTLLFEFSDLPKLNNFKSIENLFKRPNSGDPDFAIYGKPIELNSNSDMLYSLENDIKLNRNVIENIISSLYTSSFKSILVSTNKPKTFTSLVASIWLQQWPRLRRNFSFCTGAILPRMLHDKYLDLQIIPPKSDASSKIKDGLLIDMTESVILTNHELWIEYAYSDLLEPSSVRSFFQKFGADVPPDRASFRPLISFYEFLRNRSFSSSIGDLFQQLQSKYPAPNQGNALKIALLDPGYYEETDLWETIIPRYSEDEILLALATTRYYKSFDYNKLRFKERFKNYYLIQPKKALDLLSKIINNEINPFVEETLNELAMLVDETTLFSLDKNFKYLALIISSLNPTFWYSKNFWQNDNLNQKELLSMLLKSKKDLDLQRLTNTLIEANSDIDEYLLDEYSIDLTEYILNWLNEINNSHRLSEQWRRILYKKPELTLKWLKNKSEVTMSVIEVVLKYLNPSSKIVISNGSQTWYNLLNVVSNRKENDTLLKLKCFSLSLAFNNPDKYAYKIFIQCFEDVYNAGTDDKLSYDKWRLIEPHTKPLSIFNDWDKCKKLINAGVDKIIQFEWPINAILDSFSSIELIERFNARYLKKS